eukprot:3870816-Rhodomonas_salina.1
MCGTELAYGATRLSATPARYCLPYAMRGTDAAYAMLLRLSCYVLRGTELHYHATQCAVLSCTTMLRDVRAIVTAPKPACARRHGGESHHTGTSSCLRDVRY